ncbi:M20 family metallopeptidase [Brevibacterium sp. BRM-1]|uniref:M20 family metallopeptidase n=1 Tax=Brevibacterium sp. BRM-1 TaxID=2999062 RepID=UPI00227DE00B|nr:M20 family metallopeptidase [Brevibacterium sp. BRM-1]WAL39756.1 M20 family metallopeptidase [Brevibacterium sp. BRM-1]
MSAPSSSSAPSAAPELLAAAQDALPQMLADIERVITRETPSSDHAAVAEGAQDFAALLAERLGAEAEIVEVDGVAHVRLRFGSGPARVVLVNHQDTVWPHGTLERLPFSTEDGVLRGPGSFDMLTGAIMSIHAAKLLADASGPEALTGLSILVTGDEEVGSNTSSQLIRDEARGARAVFVMEASAAGAYKVARKGTSDYSVIIRGRASHAGLEPEKGVNAGLELAHQLPAVAALGDPDLGTTVTPTTLSGGTTTNTVPAEARFHVDVRAESAEEQQRVDAAIRRLAPHLEGAALEIEGGINRPPFEREAAQELYERAVALAGELGIEAPEAVAVGGGSDGNFTAGDGVPTLDGMGAVGDGAHAEHEHALIDHIAPRTALLAALIADRLHD